MSPAASILLIALPIAFNAAFAALAKASTTPTSCGARPTRCSSGSAPAARGSCCCGGRSP